MDDKIRSATRAAGGGGARRRRTIGWWSGAATVIALISGGLAGGGVGSASATSVTRPQPVSAVLTATARPVATSAQSTCIRPTSGKAHGTLACRRIRTPPTTVRPVPTPTTTAPATTTTTAPATHPASASGSLSFGELSQPLTAASSSSPFVNDFVTDYTKAYGAVGVNEMPIWTVGAHQADVAMSVAAGCNNFTTDTGTQIPVPSGLTTSGSGDSPMLIDQPSSHTEWEFWQARPTATGAWSACWGGKLDTATSDGVFPSPFGLSASGISYLATAITEADIASGSIDHAIAVDLTGCTVPQVVPADRNDCSTDVGQPPYGTRFRFPLAVAMPSGLTPFGQMVFTAVQKYGMVITDQAGAVMIQAENTSDWAAQGHTGVDPITAAWHGQQEYQVVANLPWKQLQVTPA